MARHMPTIFLPDAKRRPLLEPPTAQISATAYDRPVCLLRTTAWRPVPHTIEQTFAKYLQKFALFCLTLLELVVLYG